MTAIVVSGTGLYTPPNSISNQELVETFNSYVASFNLEHAQEIESGGLEARLPSSTDFIEKASGIRSRYVIEKEGVLDPDFMAPRIPERPNGIACNWLSCMRCHSCGSAESMASAI